MHDHSHHAPNAVGRLRAKAPRFSWLRLSAAQRAGAAAALLLPLWASVFWALS